MNKSIFRRLMFTYLVMAAGIILALSLLLSQALERHLIREKQESLLTTAEYVNTLLILHGRNNLSRSELSAAINIVGETANARVVVLDFTGLPEVTPEIIADMLGSRDEELIRYILDILSGQTVLRRRQSAGELGQVVAAGIPARNGPEITGAIILFSPVYQTEQTMARFRQRILLAAMVTFLLAFPMVSYVSGRISRPLIQVSEAADELASGRSVEDISLSGEDEVGRLVRSFNEMKNKISKMETMRSELLAGVSHELRTPLTAIRGLIQAMNDGVVPEADRDRVLSLALGETRRLGNLVNDLLEMARLESGAVTMQKKNIDLAGLLDDTIRLLCESARERDVALHSDIGGTCRIYGDEDRLRQVFLNLIGNAIRYNRPGGSVAAQLLCNDKRIAVIIKDTGMGIPARHLPYVTEKFYRVDPSRGSEGAGLGLALSKQIIEQHGGELVLTSEEGTGTTVIVTLPAQC
jgi:signal transduction histidine kinase